MGDCSSYPYHRYEPTTGRCAYCGQTPNRAPPTCEQINAALDAHRRVAEFERLTGAPPLRTANAGAWVPLDIYYSVCAERDIARAELREAREEHAEGYAAGIADAKDAVRRIEERGYAPLPRLLVVLALMAAFAAGWANAFCWLRP